MHELVSVVITTYGRTSTLKRAIKSVINQTYNEIEIIVVDDNVDLEIRNKVKKIVNSFQDARIDLICNESNLGGALSRNVGIMAARGKYIAFLDDDDEYCATKIEKQYNLFINSPIERLGLVYCYCKEVGKKTVLYRYDYCGNCLYEAMKSCFAATSQWMCDKEALLDVGCFTDMPCKQDSTVIVKLLSAGYSVDRVPEILSIYHTEGNNRISTSSHKKRIVGEKILLNECRKNYSLIDARQREMVEYLSKCRLIEHYKAIGDKKRFYRCLKTIMRHPFDLNTYRAIKHVMMK